MELSPAVRALLAPDALAHLVTINADGSPHVTIVWVGVDGADLVVGKLMADQKVANIRRDPRIAVSFEADGADGALAHSLVIEGTATITDGGAPELLGELARTYIGPDAVFPPMDDPPDGFVIRITPTKVRGVGPWAP